MGSHWFLCCENLFGPCTGAAIIVERSLVEMVPSRMLLAANGHVQPQGYMGHCLELAENKAHKEESSQAYDHKPLLQHTLL